ncbi:MAG: EscU/YscU/HrcU family type III secretion system export apparatus switch protein [Candidatus Solibacter usitatus]|nr:EscU/YscU/HrcU family type III secretion system export apparatus switch protein [Candidatus Solibacter usitatus]
MADRDQRTEQPTPQRLRKAREEGRFPVSREFVAAVQFGVFAALLTGSAGTWWPAVLSGMRQMLVLPFRTSFERLDPPVFLLHQTAPLWMSLLAGGALMLAAALGAQMVSTGLGLAPSRLTPDFSRLNFLNNLREVPARNARAAVEACVMLPLLLLVCWMVVRGNLQDLLRLPLQPLATSVAVVGTCLSDLFWKAALVLAAWGVIDLFRQRHRYTRDLRMTKQEIREELKQSEGNPEIRMRIRRLRRELLRRRMMAEVPKATAVIVNPTHFAVALKYELPSMAAPRVVAKGKNYLALRIREKALAHQVPVIENPPLAQALYKHVETGQEIPPALYRAVAEVLAYVFRLMRGGRPGA